MTTADFRGNTELVRELRTILQQPIMQMALQTLRENGPEFRTQPTGLSPTDAAIRLGHVCGYAEHHQNLELLAQHSIEPESIEAEYRASEDEKSE